MRLLSIYDIYWLDPFAPSTIIALAFTNKLCLVERLYSFTYLMLFLYQNPSPGWLNLLLCGEIADSVNRATDDLCCGLDGFFELVISATLHIAFELAHLSICSTVSKTEWFLCKIVKYISFLNFIFNEWFCFIWL